MIIHHLGFYRELQYGDADGGSIHESAALNGVSKQRVLAYLRAAPVLAASGVLVNDYFTGAELGPFYLHTDGRWIWYSDLPHYVEHHDSRLPEDFVATATQSPLPDLSPDDLRAISDEMHPPG